MPRGDLPGWHLVMSDDFTGTRLDSGRWGAYSGQPGGDPGGWWDPSHVSVGHGTLVLAGSRQGGRWVTGGVSSAPGLTQTYGKYLVRYRIDRGQGIAHAVLLWPAGPYWPPEVDFSEDDGSDRRHTTATLHSGAANAQIARSVAVDLSGWHTLGVEWSPKHLTYTLDGRVWASVTSSRVPSVPMALDLQTQAWACGARWQVCPGSRTPAHVNMYVDWVVAYARASGA